MKLFFVIVAVTLIMLPGCISAGDNEPVACTMEAKMCQDGSFVGRQGPNCEFADCPKLEFCDAQTACTEGSSCYKFQDSEKPYCFPTQENPCSRCSSGRCRQLESYPVQIACE